MRRNPKAAVRGPKTLPAGRSRHAELPLWPGLTRRAPHARFMRSQVSAAARCAARGSRQQRARPRKVPSQPSGAATRHRVRDTPYDRNPGTQATAPVRAERTDSDGSLAPGTGNAPIGPRRQTASLQRANPSDVPLSRRPSSQRKAARYRRHAHNRRTRPGRSRGFQARPSP